MTIPWYQILRILFWLLFVVLVLVEMVTVVDIETSRNSGIVSWLSSSAIENMILWQGWLVEKRWLDPSWILLGVLHFLKQRIGPPAYWDAISESLTRFRQEIFVGDPHATLDQSRVTLYRFEARWRQRGVLIPVARSGEHDQCCTKLDVHDEPSNVGSAVYLNGRPFTINGLEKISVGSSDDLIRDYARRTFAEAEWIKKRLRQGKQCSRAFHGIPVESGGKRWGVLLIDTLGPEIPSPRVTQYKFEALCRYHLEVLLEREGKFR